MMMTIRDHSFLLQNFLNSVCHICHFHATLSGLNNATKLETQISLYVERNTLTIWPHQFGEFGRPSVHSNYLFMRHPMLVNRAEGANGSLTTVRLFSTDQHTIGIQKILNSRTFSQKLGIWQHLNRKNSHNKWNFKPQHGDFTLVVGKLEIIEHTIIFKFLLSS